MEGCRATCSPTPSRARRRIQIRHTCPNRRSQCPIEDVSPPSARPNSCCPCSSPSTRMAGQPCRCRQVTIGVHCVAREAMAPISIHLPRIDGIRKGCDHCRHRRQPLTVTPRVWRKPDLRTTRVRSRSPAYPSRPRVSRAQRRPISNSPTDARRARATRHPAYRSATRPRALTCVRRSAAGSPPPRWAVRRASSIRCIPTGRSLPR